MHNAILRTVIVNTEDLGNIQVESIGECREDVQLLSQPLSRYTLGTSTKGLPADNAPRHLRPMGTGSTSRAAESTLQRRTCGEQPLFQSL